MKLYLIRHGRQDSPLCNVDVPLCEAGRRQAQLLGKRLEQYQIDALYSSALIRAVQTAEIINEHLHLEHNIIPQLREISFGELEGMREEDIQTQYRDFLMERREMSSDLPYPKGESGQMVYKRVYPVIQNILQTQATNVAIVTHGGVIRAVLAGILGIDMAKKLMFAKELENTSITQIDYHGDYQYFTVERINDYAHIEQQEQLLRKYFKR